MSDTVLDFKAVSRIKEQGRLALLLGASKESCPYADPSEQRDAWLAGWSEGVEVSN